VPVSSRPLRAHRLQHVQFAQPAEQAAVQRGHATHEQEVGWQQEAGPAVQHRQIAVGVGDPVCREDDNPIPEVDPLVAGEHAAVVATGRSDFPNQINNVLAFPGVFRGLLDAHAVDITDDMLIAAARAISDSVSPSELNSTYIVPSVFDAAVAPAVAAAVREVAGKGGESDV